MNIESYNYTLFTTIFGMLVVFVFLGILCLIMVIMKYFFNAKNHDESIIENNEWIAAAVSTYVEMEEQETYPCSAEPWKAEQAQPLQPWTGGIFTGKKIGT